MNNSIQIRLPWPDKQLSPNARCHHMVLYKAKKKAKSWARIRAMAAKSSVARRAWISTDEMIVVTIAAFPGTTRNRDEDNLIASMKAYLDGIAEGLCVNDFRFKIMGVTFFPPVADPHVFVTLNPLPLEVEP